MVPFRISKTLLSGIPEDECFCPLIWMHNIQNGGVLWPNTFRKKPIAVKINEWTKPILLKNKNYILIKRVSSREGRRRINAGILFKKNFKTSYIAIENHVNYIAKLKGDITETEAYGLTTILNSILYSRYFQILNGNTQVNASEIANIPLPSINKINRVGSMVKEAREHLTELAKENIVGVSLDIDKRIRKGLNEHILGSTRG